jgi:hypothetical protein
MTPPQSASLRICSRLWVMAGKCGVDVGGGPVTVAGRKALAGRACAGSVGLRQARLSAAALAASAGLRHRETGHAP